MTTQRASDDAQAIPIHDWDCSGHETLACQYPGCGLSPMGYIVARGRFFARHAGPNMDLRWRMSSQYVPQVWQAIARRLYAVINGATFQASARNFGFEVGHRLYEHHRLDTACEICSALEAFESMPQIIDDDFSDWVDHGGEG